MENRELPVPPDTRKLSDEGVPVPFFGLGRFAPFEWHRSADKTTVRLFWRRIALWVLVLGVTGWIGVASAAFAFVKYRRGFSEVSYAHMLFLPWKLDDYRRSKGEFLIRQGMELAERQEWRAAFNRLRSGLAVVPEHREARLMVARLYLMAGRPDVVRTTLLEGVPHHGDQLDYLRHVLSFFFGLQADDTVITLTRDLLDRMDPANPAYRMAATAQAFAFFNRSRLADAEALLLKERLLGTTEGRLIMARIAWERGAREQAIQHVSELTAQTPEDPEIYRTLIFYLREEGRFSAIRRASVARQLADPARPEAFIDYIAVCREEGSLNTATVAENEFFTHFGNQAGALIKLGEHSALSANVNTTRRVAARCAELGQNEAEALALYATALLETKAYTETTELLAGRQAQIATWPDRQRLLLSGLRGIALYGLGNEADAQAYVRPLCESRALSAQTLTLIAGKLEGVGQPAEARRILQHAVEIDPLHQPATVMLLRQTMNEKQIDQALPLIDRLLTMRKPPRDLFQELVQALGSDLYIFQPGKERTLRALQDHLQAQRTLGGGK